MVRLGLEPGAAWWEMQTNPLSHGGKVLLFLLKRKPLNKI